MIDVPRAASSHRSIRRHLLASGAIVLTLVAGVGGWAASTEFAGAVMASGQLVVESEVKKVQHPTGGIVAELRVRNGDHVKAGDVLVRLDDTQTRANLAIVTKSLDELAARQARNEAERDKATELQFPDALLTRLGDPDVARIVAGERRLFESRKTVREGQKAQLRERIAQLKEEIRGYAAQQDAKVQQIGWVMKELEGVNELWRKSLTPYARVTSLEREKSRLDGERGQFIAAIAQARGKIVETELQILQVDQDMQAEVSKDLSETRAKTAELVERRAAAEDQLKRIDIRAPQDGVVHQLEVHTIGGVISGQGVPIMLIVPESDALAVEAKVQPGDIDQLHLGQSAVLRFSTFNQRSTPEIDGTLSHIAPDVTLDPKTGINYYTARIAISVDDLSRLGDLKLMAGMPVEAFIQTSPRTVASYFIRPIQDQMQRAFRER